MMIKVYCDKCGKEVGEYEAYTILVESPEIRSWADQYMYDRKGYQLCKDCLKEVIDLITKGAGDCPYKEYPCDVCDNQTDCPWK